MKKYLITFQINFLIVKRKNQKQNYKNKLRIYESNIFFFPLNQ